jgi:hypothetical protein
MNVRAAASQCDTGQRCKVRNHFGGDKEMQPMKHLAITTKGVKRWAPSCSLCALLGYGEAFHLALATETLSLQREAKVEAAEGGCFQWRGRKIRWQTGHPLELRFQANVVEHVALLCMPRRREGHSHTGTNPHTLALGLFPSPLTNSKRLYESNSQEGWTTKSHTQSALSRLA